MNLKLLTSTLLLSAAALLTGCASNGGYYSDGYGSYDSRYQGSQPQYGREYCANCGTVVGIERVAVRNNQAGGGTLLGAIVGGALGNQVGKGDGRKAATIAGAVIGGAIGHEAEKDGRPTRRGFEISVRMQDGRVARFLQPDPFGLRQGDRVVIVNGQVQRERS
jgi:outer membrane lipoprotein SlyB